MGFEFREDGHKYLLDGVEIPSVTGILADNGFVNTRWYTEESRLRGTRAHLCCEFLDQGEYVESEAKRFEVDGYVESYRKFKEHNKIEILEIERPIYHPLYRYGGRPDRLAMWKKRPFILDLKTGKAEFWHKYQSGGYEQIHLNEGKYPRIWRAGIHLNADGSMATMEPHDDLSDGAYFLAFVTTTQARRNHGITN